MAIIFLTSVNFSDKLTESSTFDAARITTAQRCINPVSSNFGVD
jgi:hypothetical protein